MIKKFDDFINEKNTFGNFGKTKFKNEEDELRHKKLYKEKKEKERKEKYEELKKYENYFHELDTEKINKKDLKEVLNGIYEYIDTFKTPIGTFVKKTYDKKNNIGNEFMNMAWNIHKLYMPNTIENDIVVINNIKEINSETFQDIREFHKKVIKDFLKIKNVFESAEEGNEIVVRTFYKYLMFVDGIYDIWKEYTIRIE